MVSQSRIWGAREETLTELEGLLEVVLIAEGIIVTWVVISNVVAFSL